MRGHSDTDAGEPWTAGIVDPADRGALLTSYRFDDPGVRALTTSGVAERGEHVWRSDPEAPRGVFSQVSVVARDIVTADALATALLAGGRFMLEQAVQRWPVEVVAVTRDGEPLATKAFWAPA